MCPLYIPGQNSQNLELDFIKWTVDRNIGTYAYHLCTDNLKVYGRKSFVSCECHGVLKRNRPIREPYLWNLLVLPQISGSNMER